MPDDLEVRLTALAIAFDNLRLRLDTIERGCVVKHVALDRKAEAVEEELTEHDRTIDLLKAELHEHGNALKEQSEVLKWVKTWVERWGMETTSLGRVLEDLDKRQATTSQTAKDILIKLGEVTKVINELAVSIRKD